MVVNAIFFPRRVTGLAQTPGNIESPCFVGMPVFIRFLALLSCFKSSVFYWAATVALMVFSLFKHAYHCRWYCSDSLVCLVQYVDFCLFSCSLISFSQVTFPDIKIILLTDHLSFNSFMTWKLSERLCNQCFWCNNSVSIMIFTSINSCPFC